MNRSAIAAFFCTAMLAACGGTAPPPATTADTADPIESEVVYDTDVPIIEWKWSTSAGDPSVSAEDGGPGFTGEGWETNTRLHHVANPDAPKGGHFIRDVPDWPANLRQAGSGWNTYVNYMIRDVVYETLIATDPVTNDHAPNLATHWWVSDDKLTYRFRINPDARWSDGHEVTAHDVVSTIKFKKDPGLMDPSAEFTFGNLEDPVALSKYIVEVESKDASWNNFLYFGGTTIFPKHVLDTIDGATYLEDWNNRFLPGTGPYTVLNEDIKKGHSVTLSRRTDYWAANEPWSAGFWNLDRVEVLVVSDQNLAFEKAKKGEVTAFQINKAQWWAQEVDKIPAVQKGWLLKRKIYNHHPIGTSGHAINTRKPPLDDRNLRLALQHLYNRDLMIEKLYFNEYEPLTSYWQSSDYMNRENELYPYDPFRAVELLEASGWTERNGDGILVRNGQPLVLDVQYRSKLSERGLTIFQEDCRRAGIQLTLSLLDNAQAWKNLMSRDFELASTAWGALVYPNPITSWGGEFADKPDNNNITGFNNERVDELCAAYRLEYDIAKRKEMIREIDALVYEDVPYVVGWYLPSIRFLAWNRYSQPEWQLPRFQDFDNLWYTWWEDPDKVRALEDAMANDTALDPGPTENRFWLAWQKAQSE